MNSLRAFSVLGALAAVGLTGCLSTTRAVPKVEAPTVTVQSKTVEQVEQDLSDRDAAVKTLSAQVLITAMTGGAKEGRVKEYTSFKGYIFVQKPANLRVIMQLPLIGSRALDMVSNGQTFTLMTASSHGSVWRQGSDKVTKASKNGLENLRPAVFLDSLLVPGVAQGELVTMTESERLVPEEMPRKELTSQPDYNLNVLRTKSGNVLELQRIVRIDRTTMLPYEQDIYDANGEIVTQTTYDSYQTYGGQQFPTLITIRRPLDEYSLKIDVTKLTLNETFEADEFELEIPPGTVVQKMQ